jgi:hypothetical protein
MSHAASQADIAAILHAEWFYGAHKEESAPQIELPRPFAPPEADVTEEERELLVAELTRRYAFST